MNDPSEQLEPVICKNCEHQAMLQDPSGRIVCAMCEEVITPAETPQQKFDRIRSTIDENTPPPPTSVEVTQSQLRHCHVLLEGASMELKHLRWSREVMQAKLDGFQMAHELTFATRNDTCCMRSGMPPIEHEIDGYIQSIK